MKIVYVGDFRDLPNWGCRATGVALSQLLESRHTIIDRLGLETLLWTGWHEYAGPGVRYKSPLPRRAFDFFWRRQDSLPKFAKAYFRFEKMVGSRLDFISESPMESVKQFHEARRSNARLDEIFQSIQQCEAVVFNGEGTMIFSTPPRRDVLYNLFLIQLAKELGKKVYFLNAMFSDCPQTGRNETTIKSTAELLPGCAAVVCRDRWSYDFVKSISPATRVTTIPDALFTWKECVTTAAGAVTQSPDVAVPFESEKVLGKFDFSRPYLCLGGSSSAMRRGDECITAYAQIAEALRQLGLPIYLVITCSGDHFLHKVGERTGLPVIPCDTPVMAGAGIVAGASLLVSGRFHPSIMASLGGTPCVFFGSNSHKTRTLQDVLGYPEPKEFSDVPDAGELGEIVVTAKRLLEQGAKLRNQINDVTARRSVEARRVLDVLNDAVVEPIL